MRRTEIEVGPPEHIKALWRSLQELAPRKDFCRIDVVNWALQQGILTEGEAEGLATMLHIFQREDDWQ